MAGADPERRASPAVLVVTGADSALGAAVVEEARRVELPVLACGADHAALTALAGEGVVALTLSGADPEQIRVLLAVAEDRFGGVHGVVHAAGHGGVPDAPSGVGERLAAVRALCAALPDSTPQVLVLEESGRRGDPDSPLRAAAAGAIAAWARSISPAPRIVWVPAAAAPAAWAEPLLRAVRPAGLRGRVADSARRLVRRRG
jgi:NAD(P)-dependent dehydrogenase (short-subunit alcohol dehydrogenase family)